MYLLSSMAAFGLCMYCYGVSIYTMPVFLLISCIYLLASKKLSVWDALLAFLVYMLIAWPFIAVMAINYFRWDTVKTPLFTLPYFPYSARAGDILFFSQDFLYQLKANIQSLFRVAVFQGKDLPWNEVRDFGTMYLFSMPFAAVGLYGTFHEFREKTGAKLLAIYLATGVWCGIVTNTVNVNRINIIYYPVMILAGVGGYQVIRWISLPGVRYGIAAAYGLAFALFVRVYFTDYAAEMDRYFRKDFGAAVSSLKESHAEKIYISAKPGEYDKLIEILTLFWCDVDAEYFQGKTTPEGVLPYGERYIYQDIDSIAIDPAEDAVYVIVAEKLPLFDGELYEFEQFGDYCTVRKK